MTTKQSSSGASPVGSKDRSLREILVKQVFENVAISNRFGGLGNNMESQERREVVVRNREDKENENIMETSENDKNVVQGQEKIFGGNFEIQREDVQGPFQQKRTAPVKSGLNNGPRIGQKFSGPKSQTKSNKPTRGLVFGPCGEDVTLSASVGQLGGLWLLWRTRIGDVPVLDCSDQHIHARIVDGTDVLHFIAVYADPSVSRRSGLWGQLKDIIQEITEPVVVGGNFNTIVRTDERTRGSGRLSQDSLAFGHWINELSLIDMEFKGNNFTWKRGRVVNTFIAKRLDRVLCCAHTRLKWQEASVIHLPFLSSDHAPLYVQLCLEVKSDPRRRPFRFELKRWNKEVFGDVQRREEQLVQVIQDVHDLLDISQTDDLLAKEDSLLQEFEVALAQEELIWFQKSRETWIVFGDRNTRYFHISTIIRRRRNRIEMLKNDEGIWISDLKDLEGLVVSYYKMLYYMQDVDEVVDSLPPAGFTTLTRAKQSSLNKPFMRLEVEKSIKGMGRFKAPEPDGFQPVFYQDCWTTVGDSVSSFFLQFFETGTLPCGTNDALVVLIPKVGKPEKISQFRPISLCNVLFKVITKTMVLRLKEVMPQLTGPTQSSFIPGRLSADNIVVVQEAVHSMRRKQSRKGWMLLKLDLEKAYDRVRWDFLEDTLHVAGFSSTWIAWIMQCVTGQLMTVLWNGEKTDPFTPLRGLRQGDPLSPYLFVLYGEVVSPY
ncbi:PREDICTED: uncharacterized protein LOC104709399 [Camelina sativa]|uniref:Uncharacterized protein LOC104709399 n=1 Tax=Camelina sativa TaxID=90675 RepID=A0ABM0TCR7_CAMSA|nr:PREDICTED: uncharacterized protein LOC104709399 [Camelina sativa]